MEKNFNLETKHSNFREDIDEADNVGFKKYR